MSDTGASTDPRQLRAHIVQTRADLGATVEALAAKADVKARAREAAGDAADRARQAMGAARTKAADATGAALDTGTVKVALMKERLDEARHDPAQRRALTVAALVAAGVVFGVIAVVMYRRKA